MHQLIACKQIHHKLSSMMESLNSWSRSKFGVVSKEITKIKKELQRLQVNHQNSYNNEMEALNKKLDELLLREE
jgi:low affinity Fe/Cu permease